MDKRDIVSGSWWLCIAAFVLIASLKLGIGELQSPGPGFIPFYCSIFLAFCACLLVIAGTLKKSHPPLAHFWKDQRWSRNVIVAATLIAYSFFLTTLGYLLSTMGLMVILLGMGKLRLWAVLLGSLLAVVLSYSLFHYGLKMPLPKGLLAF
jgi:hypothetical protein